MPRSRVASLRQSLGKQRTHQFRGCVHFDAAIRDQAELALVVDLLLRIGVTNPIRECDLPLLELRAGNELAGAILLPVRRVHRGFGPR